MGLLILKSRAICLLALLTLVVASTAWPQTTGKISGMVTDQETGDALPGANVVIEGSNRGAATDLNGEYFIINVPPGSYTLKVTVMGYETVRLQGLQVSVNRTSNANVQLKPTILTAGEEVVVTAEKIAVKKDQTSSVRNVSSSEISILPVEDIAAVIRLQPGVVAGHFRGGRVNEVAFLIDGLRVDDQFGREYQNSEDKMVDLEPEAIQDLEVITGTFNAEYGRAMSGVVNAVTKDGGDSYHGSFSGELGNYYTSNNDIFLGLKSSEIDRNQDYKLQLSGPLLTKRLTFFANYRRQDYKNHLNGIRRFNVRDFSFFQDDDPANWFSQHTGDSSYVPLNDSKNRSFTGKLTSQLFSRFKVSLLYNLNDDVWQGYNHEYKYNPDGLQSSYRTTHMYTLQLNHLLTQKAFYEAKLSYMDNYNGWYVFENPLDPRYAHDVFFNNAGPGFYTGGQSKDHSVRKLKDTNAKLDLTWQVDKHHSLKTGVLFTQHDLDNAEVQIRNTYEDSTGSEFDFRYQPVVKPDSTEYSDIYRVKPQEFSAYIQDKMEYNEMVVNFGLRYDYFYPNTVYPSQRRNPANQQSFLDNPERMSTYPKADPQTQISPRLGLSYQLSQAALLHFSYGHFFQMPPMYALYKEHAFTVENTDYETTMGNAQLKAEKTVQYEIGIWQQIMEGMGLEVALFYRDIYDLLSARIISTFNQYEYGLYTNIDYGNAKGLELKYDFVRGKISTYLNYTLQYTRGNADNPRFTFDRAGDSRDPVPTLIPMGWDQRHTLNLTVGYNTRKWGATMTSYYNSGTPYTWSPLTEYQVAKVNLYSNNDYIPSKFSVDLTGFYKVPLTGGVDMTLTLSVYNLLDRLNEEWVNDRTGRAYTGIILESDIGNHRSDFNEYIDRVQNPSAYAAPRYVKFGMGFSF